MSLHKGEKGAKLRCLNLPASPQGAKVMKSKEKNNCRTISVFEAVRRANFYLRVLKEDSPLTGDRQGIKAPM